MNNESKSQRFYMVSPAFSGCCTISSQKMKQITILTAFDRFPDTNL